MTSLTPSLSPARVTAVAIPWRVALSVGGLAWFCIQAWLLRDKWVIPGGDVQNYMDAGTALRNGVSPYNYGEVAVPWLYGPPWVLVFAALSVFPYWFGYLAVFAAQVTALRYMARSWLGVGYLLWLPLMPFELLGGQIFLIVAAAIVAAIRNQPWLVVIATFAKISPILAAREWRRYIVPVVVIVGLTLPWAWLWPEWFDTLYLALTQPSGNPAPQIPIPFLVRLPIGLALVAYGRPWSRALGAVVALPAFYWQALVLLAAPLSVWLFDRR